MDRVKDRDRAIIRVSAAGIAANVLLAALKAFAGFASNSVAVLTDALNSLSDALSSLITIIGTKLAGKEPDWKHPLGHGRAEYLSATVISVIVLYAGVTALAESVKKIAVPQVPEYSAQTLIIIAAGVAVKIGLGIYTKRAGLRLASSALAASGSDALFDSVISASTLAAAAVYVSTGVSLESWLGAGISLFIIRSGIDMLRGTVSEIIGERIPSDVARRVKQTICTFREVSGAYDLVLHSYGPSVLIGSVHVEVPDFMTAEELDRLERDIARKVEEECGVLLTGISVYALNTRNNRIYEIERTSRKTAHDSRYVRQVHGFYVNEAEKTVGFDLVVSYDAPDRAAVLEEVRAKLASVYPDHSFDIALDYDISD